MLAEYFFLNLRHAFRDSKTRNLGKRLILIYRLKKKKKNFEIHF